MFASSEVVECSKSAQLLAAPDAATRQRMQAACERACERIAPAWPLDRAIAVNPHWQRIGLPLRTVAARLGVLADMRVLPSRAYLQQAWQDGRIQPQDLAYALAQVPDAAGLSPDMCLSVLAAPLTLPQLPLLLDVLDDDEQRHTRLSWRQAVTHQVSQTCAAWFDHYQADWQPQREQGLYAFWRETLTHDHGIGVLMGLPQLGRHLQSLPVSRDDAECWVLQRLGLPEAVWEDYLEAVLLTVNGWASWCAWLGWQARQVGQVDSALRDLLSIRLAWGVILLDCKGESAARRAFSALREQWQRAPQLMKQAEQMLLPDEVWQVALEAGYQRELAQQLVRTQLPLEPAPHQVQVQAAFCIDVRSERLRRHLEAVWPQVQTLGFAGFFGLPVAYTPLATQARRPQLPGLLAPSFEVEDRMVPAAQAPRGSVSLQQRARAYRQRQFASADAWGAASRWPGAAFSFVEAAGMASMGSLLRWLRPGTQARARDHLAGLPARWRGACRPGLAAVDEPARVQLAARILRALGLDRHLAPLVVLVGHGSQTANNAHAAALDCGACCGQTGEVNARVLAQLLNEPSVRRGLLEQGIAVPRDTVFVAALHNTTTDEIEAFDLDLLTPAGLERWQRLQGALAEAGQRVRCERAPSLGLAGTQTGDALLTALRQRANDGAQTRPEWGLAGNAAFIIAPRARTLGLTLDGRCFLHDYTAEADADGSLLELLMTAPMLVTHWINWQYHASACDPVHLGSGNKLLHNVVGGNIGVFEGNGGDLRIGLALQSLHDGERWCHEPLRLTVVIDAPAAAIERVIGQHAVVRQLVDHGWLHLWRFAGPRLLRYDSGDWHELGLEEA